MAQAASPTTERSRAETTESSPIEQLVRDHPQRAALGALCYELLSGQAEGEALYKGKKRVGERARAHELERDAADTELGNVLTWLERGPSEEPAWRLISALAVDGFGAAWAGDDPDARFERVARFVAHADWLERCSSYVPYRYLSLLEPACRAQLWEALERSVGELPAGLPAGEARARAVARLHVLAAAAEQDAGARERLARVAREAPDPVVAACAQALGREVGAKDAADAGAACAVEGLSAPSARVDGWRVVRWVTGLALLFALGRGLGWLLGVRRRVAVSVQPEAVRVRRELRLLGRTVRVREALYKHARVSGGVLVLRYPWWRLLAGVAALVAGLGGGALLLRGGAGPLGGRWLLAGVAAVVLGAGLDLLLHTWWPSRPARAELEVWVGDAPICRLRVDDAEAAQALLGQLRAAG